MNILRAGNKSPVQRSFFKNSAGGLLPPILRFLGGFYDFCNFVIIFSLIKLRWFVEKRYILQICKWSNTTKKGAVEIAKYMKTKKYVKHYARHTTLKITYVLRWGVWNCYKNVKISCLQLA